MSLRNIIGTIEFQDALADFIAEVNYPGASPAVLRSHASNALIPFQTVPVFHYIKFMAHDTIVDSVHVQPQQTDSHGRIIPSRFDTVLIQPKGQNSTPGQGIRGGPISIVLNLGQDPLIDA